MLVGRRIVVVGEPGLERALQHRAGDRLRRDPRHAGDRRLDAHGRSSTSLVTVGCNGTVRAQPEARGPARLARGVAAPPGPGTRPTLCEPNARNGAQWAAWADRRITVFLADDNVIVREGVRALLGARARPRGRRDRRRLRQPHRRRRGGRAPGGRHRHPHAAELPAGGHRRGEGAPQAPPRHRRRRAVAVRRPRLRDRRSSATAPPATPTCSRTASPRATSSPAPCARSRPAARCSTRRSSRRSCSRSPTTAGSPPPTRSCCTRSPRAGRSRRSPRRAARPRPRSPTSVEELFLKLSEGASTGTTGALQAAAHAAPGDRRPRGAGRDAEPAAARRAGREAAQRRARASARPRSSWSPCSWATSAATRRSPRRPTRRSSRAQLNEHRAEMNRAILDEGGTVMQFVGDAVMACFGAPVPLDGPRRPRGRAPRTPMLERQRALNDAVGGARAGRRSASGIGVSTGAVAAALLGSEERRRVHARRRHREPRAAAAGPGAAGGPDRAQRDAPTRRCDSHSECVRARRDDGQGAEHAGARLPHRRVRATWTRRTGTMTDADGRGRGRDARAAQDLRVRGRAGARAARRRLHDDARRVRRGHGPVGVRQVDAAQPHRRARHADRRRDRRWRASRSSARARTSSRSCAAATSGSCSSSSTCSRA